MFGGTQVVEFMRYLLCSQLEYFQNGNQYRMICRLLWHYYLSIFLPKHGLVKEINMSCLKQIGDISLNVNLLFGLVGDSR